MQFVIIFALIVAIFAVWFALQNPTLVTLHFILWDFEAPMALFMLIAIAIGAILISILTIPGWFKTKKITVRHNKEISELEDSLAKYRMDLINAQNSNKDLRQKILEVEETKEELERAQAKTTQEINDLHEALDKAGLSTQEAEQAKKEALEARDQMDQALKDLETKMIEANQAAAEYQGQTFSTETNETVFAAENSDDGTDDGLETEQVDESQDETIEPDDSDAEPGEGKEHKKHSWF